MARRPDETREQYAIRQAWEAQEAERLELQRQQEEYRRETQRQNDAARQRALPPAPNPRYSTDMAPPSLNPPRGGGDPNSTFQANPEDSAGYAPVSLGPTGRPLPPPPEPPSGSAGIYGPSTSTLPTGNLLPPAPPLPEPPPDDYGLDANYNPYDPSRPEYYGPDGEVLAYDPTLAPTDPLAGMRNQPWTPPTTPGVWPVPTYDPPVDDSGLNVSGTDPYELDDQDWEDYDQSEAISQAMYDEANDNNYSGRSLPWTGGQNRGLPPGAGGRLPPPYSYLLGPMDLGGGGGFNGGNNGQAPPPRSITEVPPVPAYNPPTYSPPTAPGQLPPPPVPGAPPFPTQWPEDSVGIPDWQAANPTGFEGIDPGPEDPEVARLREEKERNANPPGEEGATEEGEPEQFAPPVFTPPGGGQGGGYGNSAGWNGTPEQQYAWMINNGIDPFSANNPFLGSQGGGFSPPPPPDLGGQGGPPDQNVPWEQPQWTPPDFAPPDAGGNGGGTSLPPFSPPAPPPGGQPYYPPPDQGGYPPPWGGPGMTQPPPVFQPPQYTDPFAGQSDPNMGQGYGQPQQWGPDGSPISPVFQPPQYQPGTPWTDPTQGGPSLGQPPVGVPGAGQAIGGQGMNGGQLLGDLSGGFQNAQDAATAANEGRYRSILEGYGDVYKRAMGTVAGVSNQDRMDLNRQYERAKGQGEQDLLNRGLGNTTVRSNVMRGYEEDLAAGNRRLSDARMREMIGLDTSLSQGALDFAERRTDAGPDYGQLAQLGQGLGQAGYNQQALPPAPGASLPPAPQSLMPSDPLKKKPLQPLYPVFG